MASFNLALTGPLDSSIRIEHQVRASIAYSYQHCYPLTHPPSAASSPRTYRNPRTRPPCLLHPPSEAASSPQPPPTPSPPRKSPPSSTALSRTSTSPPRVCTVVSTTARSSSSIPQFAATMTNPAPTQHRQTTPSHPPSAHSPVPSAIQLCELSRAQRRRTVTQWYRTGISRPTGDCRV